MITDKRFQSILDVCSDIPLSTRELMLITGISAGSLRHALHRLRMNGYLKSTIAKGESSQKEKFYTKLKDIWQPIEKIKLENKVENKYKFIDIYPIKLPDLVGTVINFETEDMSEKLHDLALLTHREHERSRSKVTVSGSTLS